MVTDRDRLIFDKIPYGRREVAWTLEPLLYKHGAEVNGWHVEEFLAEQGEAKVILTRLPLVKSFYDQLDAKIAAGSSRYSIKTNIMSLRRFYAWADSLDIEITTKNLEQTFVDWSDYLLHKSKVVRDFTMRSAFELASNLSKIIDEMHDRPIRLISRTRLTKSKKGGGFKTSDKQNISQTFEFGHALLDITKALTAEAIYGPLPLKIETRAAGILWEWSGLMPLDKLKNKTRASLRQIKTRREYEEDRTLRTRYPLTNLRVEAELLIFIAQTGMNLSQAHRLQVGKFSYKSHVDGYQVRRIYKNRRQGEVEFYIYSEYRSHFESYLKWLGTIYSEESSQLLFPIIDPLGSRAANVSPNLTGLRRRCTSLGMEFIGPRELRKIRANWLLRQLADPSVVAEMSQHEDATLLRSYALPNHQIAAVEISRFLSTSDPALEAPAPGQCIEPTPTIAANAISNAPTPDCVNPAGCLFCEHHRDLDTFDHYWSLASYRYCKSLELASSSTTEANASPAKATIDAITHRLDIGKTLGARSGQDIQEALLRIAEGEFHPTWAPVIDILEG